MVLLDEGTGDILVVGTWERSPSFPHFNEGYICDRSYALTSRKRIQAHTIDGLAEVLGVGPDAFISGRYLSDCSPSALRMVRAAPTHPDRVTIEKIILSKLSP